MLFPVRPPRKREVPFPERLQLDLTGQVSQAHRTGSSLSFPPLPSLSTLLLPSHGGGREGKEARGACAGPGPRRARGTPLSHHRGRAARRGVPLPPPPPDGGGRRGGGESGAPAGPAPGFARPGRLGAAAEGLSSPLPVGSVPAGRGLSALAAAAAAATRLRAALRAGAVPAGRWRRRERAASRAPAPGTTRRLRRR